MSKYKKKYYNGGGNTMYSGSGYGNSGYGSSIYGSNTLEDQTQYNFNRINQDVNTAANDFNASTEQNNREYLQSLQNMNQDYANFKTKEGAFKSGIGMALNYKGDGMENSYKTQINNWATDKLGVADYADNQVDLFGKNGTLNPFADGNLLGNKPPVGEAAINNADPMAVINANDAMNLKDADAAYQAANPAVSMPGVTPPVTDGVTDLNAAINPGAPVVDGTAAAAGAETSLDKGLTSTLGSSNAPVYNDVTGELLGYGKEGIAAKEVLGQGTAEVVESAVTDTLTDVAVDTVKEEVADTVVEKGTEEVIEGVGEDAAGKAAGSLAKAPVKGGGWTIAVDMGLDYLSDDGDASTYTAGEVGTDVASLALDIVTFDWIGAGFQLYDMGSQLFNRNKLKKEKKKAEEEFEEKKVNSQIEYTDDVHAAYKYKGTQNSFMGKRSGYGKGSLGGFEYNINN